MCSEVRTSTLMWEACCKSPSIHPQRISNTDLFPPPLPPPSSAVLVSRCLLCLRGFDVTASLFWPMT
ncbi:uncharacterized protein SEPMUDRAFT_150093 [Sphaerulina musiva SO2202]